MALRRHGVNRHMTIGALFLAGRIGLFGVVAITGSSP